MLKFYTVQELYETSEINEAFWKTFNRLSEQAKKIVLDKNQNLMEHFRQLQEEKERLIQEKLAEESAGYKGDKFQPAKD